MPFGRTHCTPISCSTFGRRYLGRLITPPPVRTPVINEKLVLPDLPELAQHAAGAIAKHSRRGWRIDRPNPRVEIDGITALLMALDRLENQPAPVELIGWL